ncbi:hypothetical protein BURMUCF2_A0999 [Burkholderia multivorans CF2]|nr:hypothetical protein BURMUCF2_A0999 [Burkholderia multivorans CF2]
MSVHPVFCKSGSIRIADKNSGIERGKSKRPNIVGELDFRD